MSQTSLKALLALAITLSAQSLFANAKSIEVPAPTMMEQQSADQATEKAVLAGGCFWGVQAVFQHVKGVKNVVSGYAGGKADTAQYETVSSGSTGHAESVEITFDPKVINYGTILQIYFAVAHNPTELNFQGPDSGTQYRSAVFPESAAQKLVAKAYIDQLGKSGTFDHPIVTSIEESKTFYPAEAYHQDYATLHPDDGYIMQNDLPKVENLSHLFPQLYSPQPQLVNGNKNAG